MIDVKEFDTIYDIEDITNISYNDKGYYNNKIPKLIFYLVVWIYVLIFVMLNLSNTSIYITIYLIYMCILIYFRDAIWELIKHLLMSFLRIKPKIYILNSPINLAPPYNLEKNILLTKHLENSNKETYFILKTTNTDYKNKFKKRLTNFCLAHTYEQYSIFIPLWMLFSSLIILTFIIVPLYFLQLDKNIVFLIGMIYIVVYFFLFLKKLKNKKLIIEKLVGIINDADTIENSVSTLNEKIKQFNYRIIIKHYSATSYTKQSAEKNNIFSDIELNKELDKQFDLKIDVAVNILLIFLIAFYFEIHSTLFPINAKNKIDNNNTKQEQNVTKHRGRK